MWSHGLWSFSVVQGLPARTFTWGQTEIPRVLQYKHLGVTVTPDGRQDTYIQHVVSPRGMRAYCRWGSYCATITFLCASSVCSSSLHYAHCLSMALRCLSPPGSMLGLWRMCSLGLLV